MKWSDFYENHLDWDDDVVVKNIDKLQNLGPGNEIAEIYGDLQDEAAEKLLKKAMKTGVVFEPEDVLEIINWTEEEMTCRLLAYQLNKRGKIPFDYLIEYAEFVPDSFFESLLIDTAKKGAKYNSDQLDKLGEYAGEKTLLEVIRLTDMHLVKKDFDKLERTIDIEELYKIDEKQEKHAYGPEPWEITDAINAADYAISCLVNAVFLFSYLVRNDHDNRCEDCRYRPYYPRSAPVVGNEAVSEIYCNDYAPVYGNRA